MSNLSKFGKTVSHSIGLPPRILEKPVALSIVKLVTSKEYPFLLRDFATLAADSPVPINKMCFFLSIPAFSSAIFTAISPRETTFSPIPVVSLI